jgi:hypothetical protein
MLELDLKLSVFAPNLTQFIQRILNILFDRKLVLIVYYQKIYSLSIIEESYFRYKTCGRTTQGWSFQYYGWQCTFMLAMMTRASTWTNKAKQNNLKFCVCLTFFAKLICIAAEFVRINRSINHICRAPSSDDF